LIKLPLVDRLKFLIERQFVKGAGFQLLVVAAGIGLITLVGGIAAAFSGFQGSLPDAFWWAFLRLTDPGYLGDDEGGWKRLVSTLLTLSGYVVFLGALVAIMTQWLIARMRDFERGLTPVDLAGHVVILGWSNRTIPLLRELLGTERSRKQFQDAFGTRRLRVVILAEGVSAAQAQALRADPVLGKYARDVILREGSPLEDEAIHRAGCLKAALVIMPADFGRLNRTVSVDVEMIRSLLSIDARAEQSGHPPPRIIAELQDFRRAEMARNAYRGSLELVSTDDTLSALMVQNVLHPGLANFYREVLTAVEGNDILFGKADGLVGASLREIAVRCPKAVVLGLVRSQRESRTVKLNVGSETRVERDDLIVFLARELNDIDPAAQGASRTPSPPRGPSRPPLEARRKSYRILLLGWSRRVPNLLSEMAAYRRFRFDIDLVSTSPIEDRLAAIEAYGKTADNVTLRHHQGDYLLDGVLEGFDLNTYQSVVFLSSDLMASEEEADARAIVGHRLIEGLLRHVDKRPQILLELSDAANQGLIRQPAAETVISPLIISHLLARTALQPHSRLVFDELFGPVGAEIEFRRGAQYGIRGEASVEQIEHAVAAYGETLLGLEQRRYGKAHVLSLNPPRSERVTLDETDRVCVLAHDPDRNNPS
jgi:hypothetical protein